MAVQLGVESTAAVVMKLGDRQLSCLDSLPLTVLTNPSAGIIFFQKAQHLFGCIAVNCFQLAISKDQGLNTDRLWGTTGQIQPSPFPWARFPLASGIVLLLIQLSFVDQHFPYGTSAMQQLGQILSFNSAIDTKHLRQFAIPARDVKLGYLEYLQSIAQGICKPDNPFLFDALLCEADTVAFPDQPGKTFSLTERRTKALTFYWEQVRHHLNEKFAALDVPR